MGDFSRGYGIQLGRLSCIPVHILMCVCCDSHDSLSPLTVNFSIFAKKKDTRLLNHSVAASKALLSQVHVVQRQLIYLTTNCGIRPGQVDCKGAEIHCRRCSGKTFYQDCLHADLKMSISS